MAEEARHTHRRTSAVKALGAAAAGILLLGGSATLAAWTDSGDAPGTGISAGEITMTGPDCAGWKYEDGTLWASGGDIVPGSLLSNICDITLTVKGRDASATLSVPDLVFDTADSDSTLRDELTATAAYQLSTNGGSSFAPLGAVANALTIDETFDGNVVRVTLGVDFPFTATAANDDALDETLDAVTIALTQIDPAP